MLYLQGGPKSEPAYFCNNFVYCAKKYENWLEVDKVIAKISSLSYFGPPCIGLHT